VDPIRLTYDVPVTQSLAFALFVDEFSRWWPREFSRDPLAFESASLGGVAGADVTWTSSDGGVDVWGRIEVLQPGEQVTWWCWWQGEQDAPSHVTVRFSENDWGSRVHFEHDGWREANAAFRAAYEQWPLIMAAYVLHTRRRGFDQDPRIDGEQQRGVA